MHITLVNHKGSKPKAPDHGENSHSS